MNTIPIEMQRIRQDAILPTYAHPGDAGMDIYSAAALRLAPGDRARVQTGLKLAIPDGYEGQIRPKSGLADKHGIAVLNAPGTIDAGFRGEIEVLLINHGTEPFDIKVQMKIAQLVIAPVSRAAILEVTELAETTRGDGGFGSTGLTAPGVSEI